MSSPALPFTAFPKKTKMIWLLLLCCGFVAIGVMMIRDGQQMGWFCGGFFALGIPIFLLQLHPKSSFLTVSETGIEFAALSRRTFVRWEDISAFGTYSIRYGGLPAGTFVGFNYSPSYDRAQKGRAVSKALAGFEAGLPDSYGYRADELAALLNRLLIEKRTT